MESLWVTRNNLTSMILAFLYKRLILPLSMRPLILRKHQSGDLDPRSRQLSWRYFLRGSNWCLGLKREARVVKREFGGLTRVKTFLLLTIQPCTWLTALQKRLIRGSVVDTTLYSTKHKKTGRMAKRDFRTSFFSQTLFAVIVTNSIKGNTGNQNGKEAGEWQNYSNFYFLEK